MTGEGRLRRTVDRAAAPGRLQRPATPSAITVGGIPGRSVLSLQRTVGNRAVSAILQRKITNVDLIAHINETATRLAGATIAPEGVTAAAQAVIAEYADNTEWQVIEAALRAALAAQHALAALRGTMAEIQTGPPTFGDDSARHYGAAGKALAEVAGLAAEPARVIEWTSKMAGGTRLPFLAQIRLPVFVSAAFERGRAEAELAGEMSRHTALASVPAAQAWKLLMDAGVHETRGAYGFENEPGYMAGMMRGLKLMLETLAEPFTADLYERLHDTAIEGVRQRSGDAFVKGYRTSDDKVRFGGLLGKTFTIDGLARLRQTAAQPDWFSIEAAEQAVPGDKITVHLLQKTRQQCQARVTAIIEEYNQTIATAVGEGKLRAILKCCQDLELAHTFTDANLRTTAFLVLNRLLIQNGLSPTVLGDPNDLDGHTIDELIPLIREGQDRVRALQGQQGQERVGTLEHTLV